MAASEHTLLVDSHMHIPDNTEELASIQKNHNIYVVMNTTGPGDFDLIMRYAASKRAMVSAFAGLHPNNTSLELAPFTERMTQYADFIDGIGEIGLDSKTYSKKQLEDFITQLHLAERLDKPVSIHSRGKVAEVLDILSSFRLKRVHLHWLDCTPAELSKAIQRGYFVSFPPAAVYSKRLTNLIYQANIDNILVESDSPVKYGACFRGRASNPSYIVSVIFHVAMVKRVKAEEIEEYIRRNSISFLGRDIGVYAFYQQNPF